MQISAKTIDDFKTHRKDITPPLPQIARLVPMALYLSIVFFIVLSSLFFLQSRMAVAKRQLHEQQIKAFNDQAAEAKSQRQALEQQITKATDFEKWVQGSRPLQPLVVAITRSVSSRSSLNDLRLSRVEGNPSQLELNLSMSTDSPRQLDATLASITEMNYRTFSPRQTLAKGDLNYSATLVRQETRANSDTKEPARP